MVGVWEWFTINFKIGLGSFGGSGRAFLYHEEVATRRRWLSSEEFQEILTLAQATPGPNLVNLSAYLGNRLQGKWGAVAGVLGLTIPGPFIGLIFVSFLSLDHPQVQTVFRGFSIGSIALFGYFMARLMRGLREDIGPLGLVGFEKFALRTLLASAVTVAVLCSVSFTLVLGLGIAIGLALEFWWS